MGQSRYPSVRGFALALAPSLALCVCDAVLAQDRAEGANRNAIATLRPSLGAGEDIGIASNLRPVLDEIGQGLAHTARNIVGNATLRGSDMSVSPPDGTTAPAIAGRGIAGRTRLDAGDPSQIHTTVGAALRGSVDTRRAFRAAMAAHAGRHAAALAFLPTVNAQIDAGEGPNTARPKRGIDREQRVSLGVEASLPIFTSGVLTNRLGQARNLARAADMNFLAAERRAALDAALAHVDLRLQRRVVAAVSEHRDALARVATIAKALFRAGEVSRTDVAIARANVEALAADRADAARRLKDAEATFVSLTGRPVPARLALPPRFDGSSMERAIALAVRDSPALSAQSHGAQALAHAALAERGQYGPQVRAYARADTDVHHSTVRRDEMDYGFGVRLTVPLIAPAAVASVSAAREEAISARYGVLEAERVLRRRVAGLWNAREAAQGRARAFERQLDEISVTVKGTLREYEAGFRSITDVLEAQVKRLEATVALEGAKHERASAALRLDFATGRGLNAQRSGDTAGKAHDIAGNER